MKIRQNQGRVVHSPLSFIFQVVEMGGSLLQKYDTTSASFVPNRSLTPLVLRPQLIISDPDGTIATADYVANMVNAAWTVTLTAGGSSSLLPATNGTSKNYEFDTSTKHLVLFRNVQPQEVLTLKFSADYIDQRRGEVHHFEWTRDCSTEAQTEMNVTLDAGRWRGNVRLLPMKNWGKFGIPVQLKNGGIAVPDTMAAYQWQWWDKTAKTWSEDFTEQAWLVSGERTKEIMVDQDYIQSVVLRVKATFDGNASTTQYFVTRLCRWYGQFDYDVEFLTGKYVFKDTSMVVLNAWVANARGIISRPCRFFDIELFFAIGADGFESVGYGEEAIIRRKDLQTGQPTAGMLCRELSAYTAVCDDDGNPISDDEENVIFAQFPTKSREV